MSIIPAGNASKLITAGTCDFHLRVAQERQNFDTTFTPYNLGSALLVIDGLELATGQSPRPGAHQQQLQTIAENEPISTLLLSTHSACLMTLRHL